MRLSLLQLFRILLSLAVLQVFAVSALAGSSQRKFTVCTITINSNNEASLFKKKLSPKNFDFVEIVPGLNATTEESANGSATSAGKDWFADACQQMMAQEISCDLLIISGHFGGTFFGSSGKRLSLEELEQMSCNQACPAIMHSPNEVFLFGCNTLAGKEGDTRTPEQYSAALRAEVNEQGDRIFTDAQVNEIIAFRYGNFGQSNRERMQQAFGDVPHIYGFDSIAPKGENATESITRYLNSIPDYAKHLEQIELERSTQGMADTVHMIHAINARQPTADINQTIARAFRSTNFAQCSGDLSEVSSGYCSVFDESRSLPSRIGLLRNLLTRPDGAKYMSLAKQFFEKYPPMTYDAQAKEELAQIQQNSTIRDRFALTLKALETIPAFALDLVDFGEKLSWISVSDATERKKQFLVHFLNQGTVETTDFICSHQNWPQISASGLDSKVFQNPHSLEAMTCIIPGLSDPAILAKLPHALTDQDSTVRRLSTWLLGTSTARNNEVQEALVKELTDKNLEAKQMAAWALHRGQSLAPQAQESIMQRLEDPNEDTTLRRDLAMALFQSQLTHGELSAPIRARVRNIEKDPDKTLSEIATRIAALPSGGASSTEVLALPLSRKKIVVTPAGFKFEPVRNPKTGEVGWRDWATQTVWYEPKPETGNQYIAEMDCSGKPGEAMPSLSDFTIAAEHGIWDIYKDITNRVVRSSSVAITDPTIGNFFSGGTIRTGFSFRDSDYSVLICIGH